MTYGKGTPSAASFSSHRQPSLRVHHRTFAAAGRLYMCRLGLAFRMLAVSFLGLTFCLWMGQAALSASHIKAPKGAPVVEGEDIPIVNDGPKVPITGAGEAEEPQSRPVPPTTGAPAPVTLTAYLSEGSAPMTSGIVWRIFEGHAAKDGSYKLLQSLREPQPTLELKSWRIPHQRRLWPRQPHQEDRCMAAESAQGRFRGQRRRLKDQRHGGAPAHPG